ncbi:MAG TPA: FIST N-terminal domain-containing protein [Steroidobacteraceae bacterium]|nr:FIST N-terminal domain-containing protein [Steroidobacteraceae bacterium]
MTAIASISTEARGERAAAEDIVAQSPHGARGFTVLFCSTHYDLGKLGRALHKLGRTRVIAAATSRAIGRDGFLAEGITGFHLPAGRFKVADALIESTSAFGLPDARVLVRSLRARLARSRNLQHLFGILLVDAEPRGEERLIATLGTELGGVPIAGGSAGDVYFNPAGKRPGPPSILFGHRAHRGAAVFCLVACEQPVLALSHNYYVPGRRRLVITKADPERRLVHEINGQNALKVYTAACRLKPGTQSADAFASYPLMVRIGDHHFARGMQRVYANGTIEFACAMEPGLVVTVARPTDMVVRLREMFTNMKATIGQPELVIGFDCAARTAYMEQQGLTGPIAALLASHGVVGFSTLGEQFNTIHANNSFTCLGVAAPK